MTSIDIRPQPRQELFLASPADIVIFGGAAGGGKTWSLAVEPLRHLNNPNFGAVIFRRMRPQIILQGGLLDETRSLYAPFGPKFNNSDLFYTFPTGMRVTLDSMQYEKDVEQWQGAQIPLIEWDELTHFTEKQFFYMLSRNRSTCGVKPYTRASCNPDPDSFVAKLIAWWINQDTGYAIPERGGVIRWFYRISDVMHWYDSREEAMYAHPEQAKLAPPKSLTFIPSLLDDNQVLMQKDPGYKANLMALSEVDMQRLLAGNWKIRPTAGKIFNRAWFEIVDAVPAGGEECRGWDFAATERKMAKADPDYTAGVKIRRVNGIYYVMDCVAVQEGPTETDRLFVNTAQQDITIARQSGTEHYVRFEQEPGAAAIRDAMRLVGLLDGFDVAAVRSGSDKITRAKAFAAQAKAGNVKVLRGEWNEMWLHHMHGQPDLPHDDIMDGSSLAYNELIAGSAKAEKGPDMF